MQKIVVLNSKGGSGKTTLTTNLVSSLVCSGTKPALIDLDPQGSSTRWLANRPASVPAIAGTEGYAQSLQVTKTWLLRTPADCDLAVIDTPASLSRSDMVSATRGADAILIPVMPSDIDIHAAMKCISDLLLVAKIRRPDRKIGIVANRVRTNTLVYTKLQKFLGSLDIPLIATLRDSQNYTKAFEFGLGIHEMPYSQVKKDIEAWEHITAWLQKLRERAQQHPAAIHLLRS